MEVTNESAEAKYDVVRRNLSLSETVVIKSSALRDDAQAAARYYNKHAINQGLDDYLIYEVVLSKE
jgi:hypothetical protein